MTFYIDGFPGREIELDQKKYLYFGGTSYLGLQTDGAFQDIYISNIRKYGTNYGASRKSNIRISIYEEVERHLSHLVGSEACISLSSGYLAGQLVRQTLDTESNRLFYAPNTHTALYSPRLSGEQFKPYPNFTALNLDIRAHLKVDHSTIPVVLLDAIDFSGSNYPDFDGLKMLPLEKIILVVDDSHGIGIVGNNGGGVFRIIQDLNPKELVVCSSLGKGFGIQAGTIFGSKIRMKELGDTPFFGGASPAAPAALASLIGGSELFNEKRAMLKDNIDLFKSHIKALDKFKFMNEHPTFSFNDEEFTKYLKEQMIVVTSFRYPDADANLMSRIVISTHHKREDILLLCNLINSYF